MKNNYCWLVGNLGTDPVERNKNPKSGSLVSFSVAENVSTFDEESKSYKTSHTNWFQVAAFGHLADKAKASLKKGDRVAIHGRTKMSQYTTQSGEQKTGFEIIAEEIGHWKHLHSSSTSQSATPAKKPFGDSSDAFEDLPF